MEIIELKNDTRIDKFFIERWGSEFIVSGENKLFGHDLNGLAIFDQEKIIGLLTYHVENNECEIVTLDSLLEKQGIGSLLIENMIKKYNEMKAVRLWLMTTNDNLKALEFYQKRGFVLKAININAIEKSRQLGQKIPLIADNGIPIRDEIELEYFNV